MNKIIGVLFAVFSVLLLSSCSTSQEVTIQGVPGTEIYSPGMEKLGVVGTNAKVSFKVSSDDYFAYLLSRNAGSNEFVPFALDYTDLGYTGTEVAAYLGIAVAVGGYFSYLFLDVSPLLYGMGTLSAVSTVPLFMRLCQTQYKYRYKYQSAQSTNQDFMFAKIVDTGYKETLQNSAEMKNVPPTANKQNSSVASSTVARRKSSVSKRTLNNNAKAVSGTYSGTGYLAQKGKVVEEYSTVKVVVSRVDNNTVNVDVLESGESYFSTKNKYQVKKKDKNTYALSLRGIPDAFITIDNAARLTYVHPKVNIDGEIYTLNITAKRK